MFQAMLRRHVGLVAGLLAVGLFVATLQLTTGYSLNSLYFGVVLLAFYASSSTLAFNLALLATVFILVDTFARSFAVPFPALLFSRTVMIATLWVTAGLVHRYRAIAAERLSAEKALRTSLKNLEDATHALDQSTIVVTTDTAGTIVYVNDKFCEISKYSRDELIGQNQSIINSNLHPIEFYQGISAAIRTGQVWRGEMHTRAKDGSTYWVDATIVPVLDDQKRPHQITVISYDITERKRTEVVVRNQAALAQLGKMAAVVAHEVRNPIAGIHGALQILERRLPSTGPEQRVVRETLTRLDALNDIVQDLLLFASPRPPRLEPVPLSSIFDDILVLLKADPRFAQIDIKLDIGPARVEADREQLKQVLLNLMLNGAQAMQGHGTLTVTARPRGRMQEIDIADDGSGIAPEARDRLFEPFFTTKHRGTGLGLATARRVVEAHGGTIDLVTRPVGGTIAAIRLPGVPMSAVPVPVSVAG
jgi:PAS domain S-box-containing protein